MQLDLQLTLLVADNLVFHELNRHHILSYDRRHFLWSPNIL